MLWKSKLISLACGAALAGALWTYVMKAYPGPWAKPSAVWTTCFLISLPGEFIHLLFSSGNHGIGFGITDNKSALTFFGIATNSIVYDWLISLGWRLAIRRRSRRQVPAQTQASDL